MVDTFLPMAQQDDTRRTRKDVQYLRHGLPKETINSLDTVQVLAEQACDPTQDNSVEAIAKRTGYSVQHVRRLMKTDEFLEAAALYFRHSVIPAISRGTEMLTQLMGDPKVSPAVRIKAFTELRSTFAMWAEQAQQARPVEQGADAAQQFVELIKQARGNSTFLRTPPTNDEDPQATEEAPGFRDLSQRDEVPDRPGTQEEAE